MGTFRIRMNAFDMEDTYLGIIFNDPSDAETVLKSFNSVVDVPAFMVVREESNSEFDRIEIRRDVAPSRAYIITHCILIVLTFGGFESDMAMRAVKMIDGRR